MLLRLDSRLDDTLNCVNALVLDGCVEDVEQVHGDGERVGVVGPPERIGDVGEEVGGLRGRGDDEMGRTEHGRPLGWGPGFPDLSVGVSWPENRSTAVGDPRLSVWWPSWDADHADVAPACDMRRPRTACSASS